MPIDHESVSPTWRARHTLGACIPVKRTLSFSPMRCVRRTLSVSPTRRARHTLGACTLVQRACLWIMRFRGVHAIPWGRAPWWSVHAHGL